MIEAEAKARYGDEFRRCLIEEDVRGMMRVHSHVFPHFTAPSNETEALYSLHMARSRAESVPKHLREYSQKWLNERGFGSFMPNDRRQL